MSFISPVRLAPEQSASSFCAICVNRGFTQLIKLYVDFGLWALWLGSSKCLDALPRVDHQDINEH